MKMMRNMDELNNTAPKLSKIKKENPFETPDNYFDDFSVRLQTKLKKEKKVIHIQQNRIIKLLKPAIGLAASFAIIFMLVKLPIKSFITQDVANNSDETELIETDYLNEIEGLDENSFFALLDEPGNGIEFSEEDLLTFASVNTSEYELFLEPNN